MPIENVGIVGAIYKLIALLFKPLLAIIGALLGLVFSGDIDKDGKLKINTFVLIKATASVAISLTGTPVFLQYYDLLHMNNAGQGFIYLMLGIFGLLVVGIVYRAVEMLKGKSFSEIVIEIKQAIFAIQHADKPIDYSDPRYDRRSRNREPKKEQDDETIRK